MTSNSSNYTITYKLLRRLGIHLSPVTYGNVSFSKLFIKTIRLWRNAILQKIAYNSVILTPAPIAGKLIVPWLHRLKGTSVGKNCFIGSCVMIDSNYPEKVKIGDNVIIASHCNLIVHQRDLSDYKGDDDLINCKGYKIAKIVIEDNVLVGSGSIILPGIRIGKGAVVGTGSVVTKDVPPNTFVAGVPAKKVKEYKQ